MREDKVIRPDGKEGIYGVVDSRIACAVVALDDSKLIYLVGQYRYPIDRYSWEVIEGGSDEDESPAQAARRELREEAGLVASSWHQVGRSFFLSNCHSSERAYVFLARGLKQVPKEPDPTEVLEVKTAHFEEALKLIDGGEITDALSIMALLKVERALRGLIPLVKV